jgi:hypothetical protein
MITIVRYCAARLLARRLRRALLMQQRSAIEDRVRDAARNGPAWVAICEHLREGGRGPGMYVCASGHLRIKGTVQNDRRGRSAAGRVVLNALGRAYAARGLWKIVSRIFRENTASLALHERYGFRVVGTYKRHGKLEGRVARLNLCYEKRI